MLLSTTAGAGHFGPMTAIARACVAAGHEVRVAAPRSFAGHVERAGLAHEPFDDVPPEVLGPIFGGLGRLRPEEANAVVMGEVFGRLDAQAALPGLRELVRRWRPDVVLRDPAEFGSLAVAVAEGVPHVEVSTGMASVMEWAHPHLVEPLGELDTLVGLPSGSLSASMLAAPRVTSVPESLDTDGDTDGDTDSDTDSETERTAGDGEDGEDGEDGGDPAATSAAESDWPIGGAGCRPTWRYRAAPGRGSLGRLPDPWGDAAHPLVYVTFGSVAGALGEFASIYPAALEALADLKVRVLLTTGAQAAVGAVAGRVPDNARVEAWWPQDDVMPLAALVVGHGGFGTTMSALEAGVPQVVVPLFSSDQWVNAERVEAVGAGLRLDTGLSLVGLGDAVRRVLGDDGFRDRAGAISREFASLPEVSGVVDVIESWI
ncbi:MAG: hypothetical protein JWP82_90 [Humibacillus sp.]|nr:hypothetical protein [Humibacillus sp.]